MNWSGKKHRECAQVNFCRSYWYSLDNRVFICFFMYLIFTKSRFLQQTTKLYLFLIYFVAIFSVPDTWVFCKLLEYSSIFELTFDASNPSVYLRLKGELQLDHKLEYRLKTCVLELDCKASIASLILQQIRYLPIRFLEHFTNTFLLAIVFPLNSCF